MPPELHGYRLTASLRGPAGGDAAPVPGGAAAPVPGGDAAPVPGGDAAPVPGGAAALWRGFRLVDGLPVAVKLFDPTDAARADREAGLAQLVDHPHILRVLQTVTGPSGVGLVLPWASGGNLSELLAARRRLPWPEVLTVLIPLADALAAAHERDVVHGDVSAANVLFDGGGRPMLADLGAARAAAELGMPVAVTPTDVAPEVARGAAPLPSADVFSLGSVALHCLNGHPAWAAADLKDAVVQAVAGRWPEPDDLLGPPALIRIVRRLLHPEPQRRGSAAQAAVELRQVGEPQPVTLRVRQADGTVLAPPPATVVRPDAVRPPSMADGAGRGRPRRGATGSWPHIRRPVPPGAPRGRHHRAAPPTWRWHSIAVAIGVALLLGAGAVRAGQWWAEWDDSAPVVVPPVTAVARSGAPAGTVAGETPPATGVLAVAPAPPGVVAAMPSTPGARPVPGAVPSPGGGATGAPAAGPEVPGPTAPETAGQGWLDVIGRLDAARAAALIARDASLLRRVYTADAEARTADALRIAAMTDAGYHVTDAGHRLQSATLVGRAADGRATIQVVQTLPSYPVLNDAGTVIGRTASVGPSRLTMQLDPTGDGFRISRVERG